MLEGPKSHLRLASLPPTVFAACALLVMPACSTPSTDAKPVTIAYQVTLPSLKYSVVTRGDVNGPHPTRKNIVRVAYEAGLASGRTIDKSAPEGIAFPLGKLIPAWQVIVPMMRPGDEWDIYVPFQFAYGATGKGDVPPSTDMVFRIKLLGIVPSEPEAPIQK